MEKFFSDYLGFSVPADENGHRKKHPFLMTFERKKILIIWYYCLLRSYKRKFFSFILYVFFDVESESEIHFVRSPLFFDL